MFVVVALCQNRRCPTWCGGFALSLHCHHGVMALRSLSGCGGCIAFITIGVSRWTKEKDTRMLCCSQKCGGFVLFFLFWMPRTHFTHCRVGGSGCCELASCILYLDLFFWQLASWPSGPGPFCLP